MNRSSILYLVFILTLVFAISCSGGSGNVTAPGPVDRDVVSDAQNNGMLCIGLWQFVADKATGNVDVVQLRSADKILNVLGFMEPPPLTSMNLDWDDLFIDFTNNKIDVGVILSHPFPGLDEFSGFDVRGVCFGPKVTNADGLTILTGPEYFTGEPFGYLDGMVGAPDADFNYEGLAGYKYYCADLEEDEELSVFFSDPDNYANRGMFTSQDSVQRNYNLAWEGTGYDILVFNYAIYANYDWPIGEAPWEVDDWSITAANSAEAFCFTATATANTLWWFEDDGGGEISLEVEIWDWQGDISGVTIESVQSGVIAETSYDAAYPNIGAFTTYMYEFLNVVGDPTSAGDLDILITVTDAKTYSEAWFMGLLSTSNPMFDVQIDNCFIYTAIVAEEAPAVGLVIKISGDLPASLPTSDEKNFCVVGNDTFGKGGVYYHYSTGAANNYQFHKYPLDYSTTSTNYHTLSSFYDTEDSWCGSPADMGYIEVVPMGAVVWCTRNSQQSPAWADPVYRCIHLFSTAPSWQQIWIAWDMKQVDAMSDFQSQATVYSWWKEDGGGIPGYTYLFASPYAIGTGVEFRPGYFLAGSGDGYVDLDVMRSAFDDNPPDGTFDCMTAYLEGPTVPSAIEIFKNFKQVASPMAAWTLKSSNGLVGRGKDISYMNNFGAEGFDDALSDYLCVLEDNEDGTWQVSTWEWDNDNAELLLVARYEDPDTGEAIPGTPLNLDCDTTNNEIHAWCDDDGTTKYYVFHFG